jgi:hypothetical protein
VLEKGFDAGVHDNEFVIVKIKKKEFNAFQIISYRTEI